MIGNDSPFCKAFPSTDLSVPQREQNLKKARELLEQAGVGSGFSVTLTTEQFLEIPDYAVLIQSFAKKIGININAARRKPGRLLRQGRARPVRLARRAARHHRLRQSRRAERLPERAVDQQRHLERRALPQPDL